MRIQREELLKTLESVSPGLAPREIVEQSSCFVFTKEGLVMTFNDEICCSRQSPLKIEGAVKATALLSLLSKLKEDTIDIEVVGGEFRVKGKGKKSGFLMEAEVTLPVDSVEYPEEWVSLDAEFSEAVGVVYACAGSDESDFKLTCVHIHPDHIEACDRFQISRYPMKSGVEESTLVRAVSLKKVVGFDMTEMGQTDSWIHFRNPSGLVMSCRRFTDDYPVLDNHLDEGDAERLVFPGGLAEAVSKADIFSSENIGENFLTVELKKDRIVISGQGASGWYKEMKQTKYDGIPVKFKMSPKLLVAILNKSNECKVGDGKLLVNNGKFSYSTCTEVAEDG